ncbi:carbohydrate-binding module family 13 protein [Phycomyces blakesleeanus]|uniref:Carbohydrate-binding module family 13 protein n=2 Tax=Phycomyces blakesleeanus TaxID=4837 RepID=A0A163AM15_PHYB8|nr:carbohydrate-binding module family 13 protein [Phycomyces blakesleeanus NRRL 1555(-)]OAD74421.1 carbohydrate-binding module family 13 protein [Phycomyces blakesleeanus NRRL 1555(-)]|eukprot:XP_018292461.1 carbohydrate-binding module family 13 protein [Phycomyces blakesleeanus NRRL 1555(-)]
MVPTLTKLDGDWFYIRTVSNGNVASAGPIIAANDVETTRSEIRVEPPKYDDSELWCWKDRMLVNKSNGMVMSIRKGRLRLIEDTEICLYPKKSDEYISQQQWGVQHDDCPFGKRLEGCLLYSFHSNDWVFDIQTHVVNGDTKLILFPYKTIDNDTQRWELVSPADILQYSRPSSGSLSSSFSPVSLSSPTGFQSNSVSAFGSPTIGDLSPSTSSSSSQIMSQELNGSMEFACGLSPSKRGSQSSATGLPLETYRENHQAVYHGNGVPSSDKILAMAAAYQTWLDWSQDKQSQSSPTELQNQRARHEKTRARLQSMARTEVIKLVNANTTSTSNNHSAHRDNTISLTNRFITQLYEQMPMA